LLRLAIRPTLLAVLFALRFVNKRPDVCSWFRHKSHFKTRVLFNKLRARLKIQISDLPQVTIKQISCNAKFTFFGEHSFGCHYLAFVQLRD